MVLLSVPQQSFSPFLGFDTLATSAEDAKDVGHTLPRAIIILLVLYILVGFVMTGVMKYNHLNVSKAMSYALINKGGA